MRGFPHSQAEAYLQAAAVPGNWATGVNIKTSVANGIDTMGRRWLWQAPVKRVDAGAFYWQPSRYAFLSRR
jgi:hypothetical protein